MKPHWLFKRRQSMKDKKEIRKVLYETVGEEGCGAVCSEADIFHDEEGWKLMMEGFMGPWNIGKTVEEARQTLRELGSQGFGLS
jgi:hypothetical protein